MRLRRKPVKVGGTTKRASAGTATFSVKLNRTAKNFLRRHRKLRLTVRITVTPATGVPFTATTKLTLRR